MTTSVPLEGNGHIDNIYTYFWTKNNRLNTCPDVMIPDTIVYKYRQPAFWFFTSAQDGQIKKKNRHNVVNSKILEAFTKGKHRACEVVAYYISSEVRNDVSRTTIEYFNGEELKEFLFHRDKEQSGILQRFIDPKGEQNALIKATWSPQVLLMERRVNNKTLSSTRFDKYSRLVTYEGAEHLSSTVPISGLSLASNIQRMCSSMVDHMHDVSLNKIAVRYLVSFFKVDANDNIYFLWASELKGEDKYGLMNQAASDTYPVELSIPFNAVSSNPHSNAPPGSSAASGRTAYSSHNWTCPCCTRTVSTTERFEVTYKALIGHFEREGGDQLLCLQHDDDDDANEENHDHSTHRPEEAESSHTTTTNNNTNNNNNNNNNSYSNTIKVKPIGGKNYDLEQVTVPPILRRAVPGLTRERYLRLISNPAFLYSTIRTCEDCANKLKQSMLRAMWKEEQKDRLDTARRRMAATHSTVDLQSGRQSVNSNAPAMDNGEQRGGNGAEEEERGGKERGQLSRERQRDRDRVREKCRPATQQRGHRPQPVQQQQQLQQRQSAGAVRTPRAQTAPSSTRAVQLATLARLQEKQKIEKVEEERRLVRENREKAHAASRRRQQNDRLRHEKQMGGTSAMLNPYFETLKQEDALRAAKVKSSASIRPSGKSKHQHQQQEVESEKHRQFLLSSIADLRRKLIPHDEQGTGDGVLTPRSSAKAGELPSTTAVTADLIGGLTKEEKMVFMRAMGFEPGLVQYPSLEGV